MQATISVPLPRAVCKGLVCSVPCGVVFDGRWRFVFGAAILCGAMLSGAEHGAGQRMAHISYGAGHAQGDGLVCC